MPAKKKLVASDEEITEAISSNKQDVKFAEADEQIAILSEEEEEIAMADVSAELSEVYNNANITTYAHHGAMVQVRRDLKGKHREHTLCYHCEHFKPDTLNNCHIAQAIFDNCAKFHITTPVWDCPSFKLVK